MKDLGVLRKKSPAVQIISFSILLHTNITAAQGLIHQLSWQHAQPYFAAVSPLGYLLVWSRSILHAARRHKSLHCLPTQASNCWRQSLFQIPSETKEQGLFYSLTIVCQAQIWKSAISRTVTLSFLIWQLETSISVWKNNPNSFDKHFFRYTRCI